MENTKDNHSNSRILDSVMDRFKSREAKGLVTYGTTMDRNDLSIIEWAQHLQEELMDAVLYLEKFKQEIHYTEEVNPDQRIINIPHLEFRTPAIGSEPNEYDVTFSRNDVHNCGHCQYYCIGGCKKDKL